MLCHRGATHPPNWTENRSIVNRPVDDSLTQVLSGQQNYVLWASSSCLLLHDRQLYGKRCASPLGTLHTDRATVRSHHQLCQGQTESWPFRRAEVRLGKFLEDPGQEGRGHPHAPIGHRHAEDLVLTPKSDRNRGLRRTRLDGILQHGPDHLLHLVPLEPGEGGCGQILLDLHVAQGGPEGNVV